MLDRLLPPVCLLCRLPADSSGLCSGCRRDLPANEPACPRCAERVRDPGHPCGACQRRGPPYQRLVAPLAYQFPVDLAVTRLKFRRELAFARPLGERLALAVSDCRDIDAVVPLPLHWRRLLLRGFNQAEQLAAPVARRLGCPLLHHAIDRVMATAPQSELALPDRRRNVARAFIAKPAAVKRRRLLLIDDVVTSGATVTAATHALLRAGAAAVTVAAVARAHA